MTKSAPIVSVAAHAAALDTAAFILHSSTNKPSGGNMTASGFWEPKASYTNEEVLAMDQEVLVCPLKSGPP
jgi:hypothetical protein